VNTSREKDVISDDDSGAVAATEEFYAPKISICTDNLDILGTNKTK
jgi:hypothetical protein